MAVITEILEQDIKDVENGTSIEEKEKEITKNFNESVKKLAK